MAVIAKRGVGAGGEQGVDLNSPPYAIHNGKIRSLYFTWDGIHNSVKRSNWSPLP